MIGKAEEDEDIQCERETKIKITIMRDEFTKKKINNNNISGTA